MKEKYVLFLNGQMIGKVTPHVFNYAPEWEYYKRLRNTYYFRHLITNSKIKAELDSTTAMKNNGIKIGQMLDLNYTF